MVKSGVSNDDNNVSDYVFYDDDKSHNVAFSNVTGDTVRNIYGWRMGH
jgi:hypothetical protein